MGKPYPRSRITPRIAIVRAAVHKFFKLPRAGVPSM
jgi:hypothetical protein